MDALRNQYGIRSFINLRDDIPHDIPPAELADEKAAAEKASMTFYHFPLFLTETPACQRNAQAGGY